MYDNLKDILIYTSALSDFGCCCFLGFEEVRSVLTNIILLMCCYDRKKYGKCILFLTNLVVGCRMWFISTKDVKNGNCYINKSLYFILQQTKKSNEINY